jgi:hypothetical protein
VGPAQDRAVNQRLDAQYRVTDPIAIRGPMQDMNARAG